MTSSLEQARCLVYDVEHEYIARDQASVRAALTEHKRTAVAAGDQAQAKEIWCLETLLNAQEHYLSAFQAMRAQEFPAAWTSLVHAENALHFLRGHLPDDVGRSAFIAQQVENFQTLFPYRIFTSPELVIGYHTCSVCGAVVRLRTPCGHEPGEIYDGEMCHRKAHDVQLVGVALVRNPVMKTNVISTAEHPYDFPMVAKVITHLSGPFAPWHIEWNEMRLPHSLFAHIRTREPCPCNSRLEYGQCCLNRLGVRQEEGKVTIGAGIAVPPWSFYRSPLRHANDPV